MKTKLRLLLAPLALFLLAAVASPVVTTTFQRVQWDQSSPMATGFFQVSTVVNDQTFVSPTWTAVTWDVNSTRTITFDYTPPGEKPISYTLQYGAVMAGAAAIAEQERVEPTLPDKQ